MQAWQLKQLGWKQRDIAVALAASEGAVSQWLAAARRSGLEALQSRPAPGHPTKLTAAQRWRIPEFLWHGAEAYGFRGQVWTCARIAHVLREEFGVRYSKSQVSRILKELHWTPQVPLARAVQRDERAIERWRQEVWPQLWRQARRQRRAVVFVDESGFYLLPGLVKTYSPQGRTPTVRHRHSHEHLSVMGGLTPAGAIYVLVRREPLTGWHVIEFLRHLLRLVGPRLLVVWDGSPIHRRQAVKDFVVRRRGRVQIEVLPGYAPELNPWDQGGWQHLKHVEMRNLACVDLDELHLELHLAIGRLRQKPHLVRSFFKAAGLRL